MNIKSNFSLKNYNTFGIDASAKHFISVIDVSELQTVLKENKKELIFILGGGSNMLLTRDVDALVIHVNIKGIEILDSSEDRVTVKAMAGENWHEFVMYCISNDFGGIENLSLIPGNVGTAPIQNIGAYGVELKDVFKCCEAVDLETGELRIFEKSECNFNYRHSIFKTKLKGKYIITSVTFELTRSNHILKTSYGAILNELNANEISEPAIKDISEAVIKIRQRKLPDPKKIGNSGSFFKNPIISKYQFEELKQQFRDIPSYEVSQNRVKIPAGWLIENAGFKGKSFGRYGVHTNQALVLVNYGKATGKEILDLANLIQLTVSKIFNIKIEAEVNII